MHTMTPARGRGKPLDVAPRCQRESGAVEKTRTSTGCYPTAPSTLRVYQFRHDRAEREIANPPPAGKARLPARPWAENRLTLGGSHRVGDGHGDMIADDYHLATRDQPVIGVSLPDWFAFPNGYSEMDCQDRLDVLDRQDLIYWPRNGKIPRFKRYASVAVGNPVQDIIVDVRPAGKKERLGYETQKPVKLLERIIESSSNPCDVVLDPFCGCGTTIEAAHRLNRRWIGIDISGPAIDEIQNRLGKHGQLRPTPRRITTSWREARRPWPNTTVSTPMRSRTG